MPRTMRNTVVGVIFIFRTSMSAIEPNATDFEFYLMKDLWSTIGNGAMLWTPTFDDADKTDIN